MSAIEWRKKEKEGYFQIERHVFVKKDDLDYYTEQDLVKRYADKRGMPVEAIADLYRVFMNYLNKKLTEQQDDEKGYYVPNLSKFMKKNLYVSDLAKNQETLKFKKAKKQLDLYMKTGNHCILK
jgi:hypothetical protein